MAGKNVIELNDQNFESEVIKSDVPVLVDDHGERGIRHREVLADEYAGKYKVAKMDIDESPTTTAKFGIRGVPTVIVFKGGQKSGQHVGVTNKETLVKLLTG